MSQSRQAIRAVMLVALLVAGLLGGGSAAGATDGAMEGRRSYTGWIDGAEYRVEVPRRWNGTLVLYSHPYYGEGFPEFEIGIANRAETEGWLLEHGYALAASDFTGRTGFLVEQAMHDQLELLDWFEANVGRPRHTIATGSSGGGVISIMLAERNPRRFSGILSICGPLDLNGSWNALLDITFAIKALLARPDQNIEVARAADPAGSAQVLQEVIGAAMSDRAGQARLALAAAFGNVIGWNSAVEPRPTEPADALRQQAEQVIGMLSVFGPIARADLERRAGGNPSWNVGIDYRRQLLRSDQRDLVRQAYRTAGLDLDADLDRLAAAPRIGPDPAALGWMYRFAVPRGRTPAPVLTLHNSGDGGAVPDHERWYAEQVRRTGEPSRLRQLWVDRGTHCAFTAAEEIVAMQTLTARIDTGRWPDTDQRGLNAAAGGLDPTYQLVYDYPTDQNVAVRPAFTHYTPPSFLRPSR